MSKQGVLKVVKHASGSVVVGLPLALATAGQVEVIERFARERTHFERLVLARYVRVLTTEDAEDIVTDALVEAAARCPTTAEDGGRAWFARVVLNRAEDYRRARDGRPRAERGHRGEPAGRAGLARSRTNGRTVPLSALDEGTLAELSVRCSDVAVSHRDAVLHREHAAETIAAALASLPADDRRLLRTRFLAGDGPRSRAETAAELGLSLTQYELRHTRAWRALVAAIASMTVTEICARIRTGEDAHLDRHTVDAHLAVCIPCRLQLRLRSAAASVAA